MRCFVRQPGCAGNVANGPDIFFSRPAIAIRDDVRLLEFDFRLLKAEIFNITNNADRHNDAVHSDVGSLAFHLNMGRDMITLLLQRTKPAPM